MFCPACGTAADPDDRFCQRCGKPLPADTEPSPTARPSGLEGLPQFPPYVEPTRDAGPGGTAAPPPTSPDEWGLQPPQPGPAARLAYGSYPGQAPAWPGYASVPGVPLAPFGAPLAGWWQRVGSMLLDVLVVGVPMGILNVILNASLGTRHLAMLANGTTVWVRSLQGSSRVALLIADFCVPWLYFAILNGMGRGQTPGNHAPRIAVRDVDTGQAIGFSRGLLRWFIRSILYVALVLPGLLNDLFPLWDSRHQSIADKAARSVVIRLD
jgi:uncharacterized RDD family membrane protein YckC